MENLPRSTDAATELTDGRGRGELLELLFAHVAEAIFVTEMDGRIIEVNPAACEMLGYGKEELLGMVPWDFVTSASRDEILESIRAVEGGLPVVVRRTYRRKHGEQGLMDLRLTRCACPNGDLLIASCRDLTEARPNTELEARIAERTADLARINQALQVEIEERTRAKEALQRNEDYLRLVIDTIPGLVWSAMPDGHIEYLNERWIQYTGLTLEEAIGWGWQAAIHPEDLPGLLDYWQSILAAGKAGETEARLRRFDGEYRWFLFRGVPLYDESGNLEKWYGTNTDIEDRKRAKALLAGENQILEMVAKRESLPSILNGVCQLVEGISSGSLCAILLLDETGRCLRHGAAPSLPASYTQAIDGSAIGPGTGPCGRAAYLRQPIIIPDIATESLGADHRDLALRHGLRACWSTPILSSDGRVLGTFAIYSHQPRSPALEHHKIIGQITHLAAVAVERQLTEAALQESEERFRRMADTIPEVIWITALEPEKVLYASPSFERIWGLPVEELYRNPRLWTEAIHPDDRARVSNTFTRWLAGEEVSYHDVEYRILQPNGATRWIHERGVLTVNEQGKAYRASGISTDITEHKRAEVELRRSEAYLAEAQRLSLTGSFGWKVSSGEFIWSDETFCILGYDRAAKPGLDLVFKRVHPEDFALVQYTLDLATRHGTNLDFEHRLRMPDGRVKHVHVVARAVREESGALEIVGAVMDMTAHKSSQQALEGAFQQMEALKNQFRLAVDTIPELVWSCLPDGHVDFLNQRWREYTGLTLDEASGWGWQAAVHPEDLPGLLDYWQSVLASGKPGETEARLRRDDGEYRWFLFRAVPLYDEAGSIAKWYGSNTDIEERKRAEQQLRRSESSLARAQRLSATGSFSFRFATGEIALSEETYRIYEFDPKMRVTPEMARDRIHPEDVVRFRRMFLGQDKDFNFECRLQMPDGSIKSLQVAANLSRDDSCQPVEWVGAVRDVTEQKKAEEALRASEHLARGQLNALTHTLDALAQESEPDKFLEHVLRTTMEQLSAHSVSVWDRNEDGGWLDISAVIEGGRFQTRREAIHPGARILILAQDHPVGARSFARASTRCWRTLTRSVCARVPDQIRVASGIG